MKKIILLLLTLSIIGCSGKTEEKITKKTEQKLRFVMASDPKFMDPGLNSESVAGALINNLFEGLMREVGGELKPGITKNYKISEDKKTYTFNLKETKWSDGKPLTANDFKYSWIRALSPETSSVYAMLFFPIKGAEEFYKGNGSIEDIGIEIVDDYTLKVELNAPTPYFLDLTAFYTYLPVRKDIIEKYGETWTKDPNTFISNGPFKLESYSIGDKFVLVKNKQYWNVDNIKLEKIEAPIISDESTALTAFENKSVDIISNIPSQELIKLSAESNEFYITPGTGTYFYIFNNNKYPTDNINVRKALTYAIDRKSIVENITKGQEIPAKSYIPITAAIKDSKGDILAEKTKWDVPTTTNIEKARKYLAEAGFPDGKGFPKLELLYNTSENHKAIAEAMQAMWKENLNIDVKLINQEWAVFLNTRGKGEYSGVARFGGSIDYPDALSMLEVFSSVEGSNSAQWIKPTYNTLLEKIRVESNGDKRDKFIHEAEDMLLNDYAILPLYYYTNKFMVNSKVKGWERASLGFWYFGNISIED